MSTGHRVLILDDDPFTRALLSDLLSAHGYTIQTVDRVSKAISAIDAFDPHVVILDLDLGDGPTGVDALNYIADHCPWVAVVVMTAFRSPTLIDSSLAEKASELTYLVKGDISSGDDVDCAIQAALAGDKLVLQPKGELIQLTADQVDVLRMMASGHSNQDIADERGTGLRAAEAMVRRTLDALGYSDVDAAAARPLAIRKYLKGSGITVR